MGTWNHIISYRVFSHCIKPVTNAVKQVVEMVAVLVVIEMSPRFTQVISLIIACRL